MNSNIRTVMFALLLLCLSAGQSGAQKAGRDAEGHEWWQHAVFYEVYPRSFGDSDNNGVGDLKGITSKLEYLERLGVDAIWITPCFPSPQVDFGYDVSDYESIDPMYGTLADFDELSAQAKKHHIRIILDFVVNHTSDQHKWFLDSKSSRTAAHRDWYIWRDGKGPNQPPNNWTSTFGTAAWTWDETTKQYYYHYFYPQQPDLNWRNPAVEKAMFDTTRFWYKRGVSGFRLDAVDTMYEDPKLPDNPPAPGMDKFGRPNTEERYNKKLPEVHTALQRLRKVANEYDAVLIGETWTQNVEQLKEYYGVHNDELQMPMDLMLPTLPLSASAFRDHIGRVDGLGGWPTYVITNHDITRSYTRYADGAHNDDIAKLMATLYLTLRGTAILYYGEEIGMQNNDPKSKEEVQDPVGKLGWPMEKGRDGERTPMQWTAGPNAGFSSTKPWLPVPESASTHNVEVEERDPNSVLAVYKELLRLRHTDAALLEGKYMALNEQDKNVYSFMRMNKGEAILVVLNMSGEAHSFVPQTGKAGFGQAKGKKLLATAGTTVDANGAISLGPYGTYVARLTK